MNLADDDLYAFRDGQFLGLSALAFRRAAKHYRAQGNEAAARACDAAATERAAREELLGPEAPWPGK